jgi:hypothetical protein
MFGAAMPIRKTRITKVLMWAMIPLIVVGSMPRMGCICADGQHKMFCQRHLQGNRTGGCVCCQGQKAVADGCATKHSPTQGCCQSAGGKCSSECPSLAEGRPCRPVVDRNDIVTATKAALDLDRVDAAPPFAAVELLPAVIAPVAADFFRGESLPPPDLITTLGVLLI